jgi:hypothetical protein
VTRHYSIAELARLFHSPSNPWKALALLRAYFDDSGTHAGSPIVMIAGYVATEQAWDSVQQAWKRVLDEFASKGVTWFHMSEFQGGHGQFAGLDEPLRKYLINQLSGILETADVQAIWAGVNAEEWDELTTPRFLQKYPKPYHLCFDEVVSQLWRWSRHHAEGTPVPIIFAAQNEYQGHIEEIYTAWRKHPRAGEFLGQLSYGFPKQVIPLQTADMLAYEARAEWEMVEFEELNFENALGFRPLLDKITKIHGLAGGGLYGRQGLKTAIARFEVSQEKSS